MTLIGIVHANGELTRKFFMIMERLRSDYRGKFVVFSDWFVKRSGTDQSLDATKRVSSPYVARFLRNVPFINMNNCPDNLKKFLLSGRVGPSLFL